MNFPAAVLFSLLALLVSVPMHAQEAAQEPAAEETAAPVEATAPTQAPATDTAAVQGSENPLLDDYEASEQISEDLSVAFPVDI